MASDERKKAEPAEPAETNELQDAELETIAGGMLDNQGNLLPSEPRLKQSRATTDHSALD